MTTTQSTQAPKTDWIRRLAAGAVLAAAPAMIAMGAATCGHADAMIDNPGPTMSSPAPHQGFPHLANTPTPGTPTHRHHQNRH
mgnify:FL=1